MLTRWDPFREMVTMRRAMDRLIESSLGDQGDLPQEEWMLPLDVVEQEDQYLVKASLPGIKPEDIDITYNKGVLTIKAELKEENEKAEGQYHLRERRSGTFVRSISLPGSVKGDEIQADYNDGVLELRLPKSEEVKPKRIAIQSAQKSDQKMLNGKAK
jgi:HSP20 family protein